MASYFGLGMMRAAANPLPGDSDSGSGVPQRVGGGSVRGHALDMPHKGVYEIHEEQRMITLMCDCHGALLPVHQCPHMGDKPLVRLLLSKYERMAHLLQSIETALAGLPERAGIQARRAPPAIRDSMKPAAPHGEAKIVDDESSKRTRRQRGRHTAIVTTNEALVRRYWVETGRLLDRYNAAILALVREDPCSACADFVAALGTADTAAAMVMLAHPPQGALAPRAFPACHVVATMSEEMAHIRQVGEAACPHYVESIRWLLGRGRSLHLSGAPDVSDTVTSTHSELDPLLGGVPYPAVAGVHARPPTPPGPRTPSSAEGGGIVAAVVGPDYVSTTPTLVVHVRSGSAPGDPETSDVHVVQSSLLSVVISSVSLWVPSEQVEAECAITPAKVSPLLFADGQKQRQAMDACMPKLSVNLSLASNVALVLLKFAAFIISGSMIMLASAVDSVLDILSGLILVIVSRFTSRVRETDFFRYPAGKQRISTIGFLVFACIMATFSLQIIIQSVTVLIDNKGTAVFEIWSQSVMGATVLLKLGLFVLCTTVAKRYSDEASEAYAQDHRNDVVSNAVGLGLGLISYYYVWWIDPAGSILISLWILFTWIKSAVEQVKSLAGTTASSEFKSTVTFIAANFDDRIVSVDYVEAFHVGKQVTVEVHVVMPEEMCLRVSHDIAEDLQMHIERMAEVEKCFVHVDVDSVHANRA